MSEKNAALLALGTIVALAVKSKASKRQRAGSQDLSLEQILAMAEEAINTPAQALKKAEETNDSVDEERPLDESDTAIIEENLDFDDIFELHAAAGLYRRLEQLGVGRNYEVCVELAEELVRTNALTARDLEIFVKIAYRAAVRKGYIPEWMQSEINQRYGLKP